MPSIVMTATQRHIYVLHTRGFTERTMHANEMLIATSSSKVHNPIAMRKAGRSLHAERLCYAHVK